MYEILVRDQKAICPICSGLIISKIVPMEYHCIDCHTVFRAVEQGSIEDSLIMQK